MTGEGPGSRVRGLFTCVVKDGPAPLPLWSEPRVKEQSDTAELLILPYSAS